MSIHFNLNSLDMSILFSTFVVEIKITFSPPETRIIGKYMLHAEFHIFEQCDRIVFENRVRTILRENGQKDYHITTHGNQVVLDIANLYSYAISFHLISCIEGIRIRLDISGYLASMEFQS